MSQTSFFSKLFIVAALWNLLGAIFGYFNTAFTYEVIFNRELTDPLMFTVYKGAWGTTLVYFIGYFIVSHNPEKHYGIVITGGIGKLGYVINLMQLYFSGQADPIVFIIIIGDFIFLLLFLYYFFQLTKSIFPDMQKSIANQRLKS